MYAVAKFISYLVFRWRLGWRDGQAPKPTGDVYKLHEGGTVQISKWHMERLVIAANNGTHPKIAAIKLAREIWALSLKDAKELIEDLGDSEKLPATCRRVS